MLSIVLLSALLKLPEIPGYEERNMDLMVMKPKR